MMQDFAFTTLATVAALLVYMWTVIMVGRSRLRHQIAAPAMDGPPEFLCRVRVQVNTVEQLLPFLPALWLFALGWGDQNAAIIGAVWVVGRIAYAVGYYAAPSKRAFGFLISVLATLTLIIGTAAAAVQLILR